MKKPKSKLPKDKHFSVVYKLWQHGFLVDVRTVLIRDAKGKRDAVARAQNYFVEHEEWNSADSSYTATIVSVDRI